MSFRYMRLLTVDKHHSPVLLIRWMGLRSPHCLFPYNVATSVPQNLLTTASLTGGKWSLAVALFEKCLQSFPIHIIVSRNKPERI